MALPIIPIALAAGTVALVRSIKISTHDQLVDDYLDDLEEGLSAHRLAGQQQFNATARYKRTVRIGQKGPGFEIDAIGLTRLRFCRIKSFG